MGSTGTPTKPTTTTLSYPDTRQIHTGFTIKMTKKKTKKKTKTETSERKTKTKTTPYLDSGQWTQVY